MDSDKRIALWEGRAAEGVSLSESAVARLTFNSKSAKSGRATSHSTKAPVTHDSLFCGSVIMSAAWSSSATLTVDDLDFNICLSILLASSDGLFIRFQTRLRIHRCCGGAARLRRGRALSVYDDGWAEVHVINPFLPGVS